MIIIAKYIKKPVVIEAFKFNGLEDYLKIVKHYKETNVTTLSAEEVFEYRAPIMIIQTLEGAHAANAGDYIIKGIKGEYYPCKPDIFEMTYEKVEN